MTLVDTSVWIDFLEGRDHWTKERLKEKIRNRESIGYTELILLEIIQGIHSKQGRGRIEGHFKQFVLLQHRRSTTLLAADIYQALVSVRAASLLTGDGCGHDIAMVTIGIYQW